MRRITSKILLLLAFCLICTVMIATSAVTAFAAEATTPATREATVLYSGACGTGVTWSVDSTGTLRIEGSGSINSYSYGYAPWYSYREQITNIVVSDGITSISSGIFYGCSSLKEMTLPFVGDSRYYSSSYGYKSLFGYIFGGSSYTGATSTQQYYLNSRGDINSAYYFIPTSLTKVTITDASDIYYGAFYNCSNITEINLNDGLKTVGDYAFYGCSKLDTFKLPSSLTSLGAYAMDNCDALTDVEIPIGVTTISNGAFYDCNALANVKFHDNITSIGSSAFYGCNKLENVDLPENLTTIDNSAFAYCTNFTSIVIPDKVTKIGSSAFSNCSNVLEVTIGDSVTTIGSYAFYNCSNVLEVTIGKAVTTIEAFAFKNLSKITEITVPNSVSSIGSDVFSGCSSLKEMTLPFVGDSRYYSSSYGYKSLFGYIFGDSSYTGATSTQQYYLNSRGDRESSYYYIPTSLTKVTITDASTIYYGAFYNCSNITELNLNDGITTIQDYAFYNLGMIKSSTNGFVISGEILLSYKGTDTQVIIPDGIKMIAPRAFYGNKQIGSVTLADDTVYIGTYAFYNCSNAIVTVPKISGTLTIETSGFTNTGSVKYLDKYSYTNGNDTFYYTVDGNGKATIVGCSTTSLNITLPNTLGGYTVTTVGYKGMANCNTLTGVTIPNNIVKLDLYAFAGCTGLDTATIPATCVYVGEYAFAGCTSMTSVVIAEGVTYLGNNCFENCTSLTEIVVPDSCTYLGEYAFYNCGSLESATIGITVPSIEKYTFYNCKKLKTVVIGIKVETIGEYAFYNCALERVSAPNTLKAVKDYAFANNKALTRVAFKSGIEKIGEGAFYGDALLSTINFPVTLETVGAYAFYDCAALTSVTLPVLVEEINDYTFANCTLLTTLKINAKTVTVGDKAFAYCSALNSVTLSGKVTSIGEKAFYRDALTTFNFTDGLTYIGADAFAHNPLVDIVLPNTLTHIGEEAFNECVLLATVSMPDSVTYVGAYAFYANADDLTVTIRYNSGKIADYMLYNADVYKVIMENGITEIGDYVFALCHELTKITFPNTLEVIGNYAFYDNRMYSELTLPNTVESIGEYAFARGYRFVKINIPDSVQSIGEHAFLRGEAGDHVNPEFTVHFYYNKGILCDNILDGQDMQHIIVADYIHTVGNNAFSDCPNLIDILLPDTISSFGSNCFLNDNGIVMNIRKVDGLVDNSIYREKLSGIGTVNVTDTNIGEYAFYGNSTVKNVNIVGVKTVGKYAFSNNSKCQYVTITGNTNIGDYAFSQNIGLVNTTVTGTSNIGNYSFYNCNSMTDFVIDGTIVRIGEHAFDSCKALKAMALPTTVNYIGSYAFYDCNSMKSINIPVGIEKILSHTFYGCASLGSIEVPNSVIAIEDYAFYGCVVAKSITLSNQCKTIGEAAFYNCKALTELNIPDSVTTIGAYAFRSCGGITELVFSDNVDEIGACAFYDCNGLLTVKLGKKIIELGDRLFYGCVNLESLYVYAPLSYIDTLAFYGADFVTIYCGYDEYMINYFDENGLFYEILDDIIYEYKITFVTDDGVIISSATYPSGGVVVVPQSPSKQADNTYRYVFAGWDQDVMVVGGNKTYTASFTPVYIEYTVEFKDYNGDTISTQTYHYGDTVTAPSSPTRVADNTYTYAFAGWNNEVVACAGDTIYTATYTPTYIEYTVVFKDYNGDILGTVTLHYGDSVTAPANPTRESDVVGTYSFAGWDKAVVACAGNTEYTATYEISYIDYTVTFKDYNGAVISTETYHYGDDVVVPSNPTKAADNTYTYAFAGWDKNVATTCDGNKEYTATYTPTFIDYTVVFKDYNGDVISTKTYHYGDTVVVPSDPTREADNTYTYAFAGWDTSVATTCDGNKEYTATYTPTFIDYTVVFKDYNGTVLSTETYHYGETVTAPADPTREADVVGSYTFKAWDKAVVACAGNTTYTATYDISYTNYTVVFKNYNGDVLSTKTYHYGDIVSVPAAPTKPADETYTYAFIGWDKTVTKCEGNTTYTAEFAPTNVEYTVVFKNVDGTVLSEKTYYYGAQVEIPSVPTKAADNTYTYTFAGWDKEVVDCVANVTYTATYTPVYIDYIITFVDYDGTEITSVTYHYGDSVTEPSAPSKAADNTYTYTFAGWDKTVVNCDGNVTYIATYESTYIDYTVIFKDEDGTVLIEKIYHYGEKVIEPSAPTKTADNTYTYAFAGWDKVVVACNGNETYTATYTSTYVEYTVVFKDWNGVVISSDEYHYGQAIAKPNNPTRESNETYTYTFTGWDKPVTNCTESVVYTATYSSNYIDYEIVFKNYDGSILSQDTYHYGDSIYVPNAPTKPADDIYTYGFAGWDSEVTACLGNKTYTATFNPINVEYTVIFKDWNGDVISSEIYHFGDAVIIPENPTRKADSVYTYTFKDWGKTVTDCVGDAEYTAVYKATYIEYNVKFLDWNGTVIDTVKYHYGDTITAIADPERESDETYTYTFSSWNKPLGTCTGNASFTAQYDSTFINYTVVFKDYDGTVISRKTYHYGDAITIPADPVRMSDDTYSYTFKNWGNISTSCNGNKDYTAVYDAKYIDYTVIFNDYDGKEISKKTYHFGDNVVAPTNPTRKADNTYTYVFAGWDKEVVQCDGDATYTATYDSAFIDYTVEFKNYDGSVISSGTYHYGDAVLAPITPVRETDAIGSYTFKGWDKTVVDCEGDATYIATFETTYTDYTVIFKDEDGTVLSENTYHYGDEVTAPKTPVKAEDDAYIYTFAGWDSEIVACEGNATYVATYSSVNKNIEIFNDKVELLADNSISEELYGKIYEAIQIYCSFNEDEKQEVEASYQKLLECIEKYNEDAEIVNAEQEKATEIAFAPLVPMGFTFIAAIYFLLKRKFFI